MNAARQRILIAGRRAAIVLALALIWSPASTPRAQDSPLLAAMQDEMRRSMAELRLEGEPAPYHIQYRIDDLASMRAVARLGGLVDDLADRSRTLEVQVRVGEYMFDSSRFVTQDRGAGVVPSQSELPASLDDNYDALRRQLWLTTDAAYKRAVGIFAKKKATFQNRAEAADVLPDFSRETPVTTLQPGRPLTPSGSAWVDRVRQLSAVFASSSQLDGSEVWLGETHGTSYYLNSEGFRTITPIGSVYLRVIAEAQADDGSTVRDLFTVVESRLEDLPPMPELMSRAAALARRTEARRSAPVGEEFTGPVLIEGQASGELLRQTLVPLVLARRAPDGDAPRFAQSQGPTTPFLARIGLRVLSDSFSITDTPSLKEFDGRPVAGAYLVDDEAVPAKDVTVVDKGRLLTLLTSRTPLKNLPQSNGHGRNGSVQSGVLQVRSTQAIPASELKTKYLELLKAQALTFGYIVRAIAGPGEVAGGQGGGPIILDAVKVTPDGKEEPVRGLRFGDVPSTAFRDILEASEELTLHNYRINVIASASVISPNLIFEELEIQRTREIVQKPPVVPSPLTP
jgi:predicted Zn-dependent protease